MYDNFHFRKPYCLDMQRLGQSDASDIDALVDVVQA
jgi:hypothetical protein